MDKYEIFKEMLALVADNATVTDADMSNWRGSMEVVGEDEGHTITIEVTIEKKEENEDA